jgi:ABC-type transport system involved in multi-copper enzyme maturation permease subunit
VTTVAVQPTLIIAQPAARVGWREIAQVFWLERRGALLGFAGLLAAFAIAIVIGEHSTAASYGRYVADGCVQHPITYACETNGFANNSDFIPSLRIVGDALPVVVGMFLGAPLLAREYESGTFRFTWTQAVGRRRFVIRTLVLAALVVAAFGIVVGLLLDWVNHPFEVVAHMSQWTAGNFDAAPMLMAAWCIFGLFVGVLFGAVIGRTVAAIAAAAAVLGGLAIGATVLFVHWLLAIGAVVTSGILPITNSGMVNQASLQGQPFPGSWFVRAWYTGPQGNVLSDNQVMRVEAQMYNVKAGDIAKHAKTWLSVHHYSYHLVYQPQDRFWLFQLAAIALLLVVSAVLVATTTWVVDRRRA